MSKIDKKSPFKVPDGYFNHFDQKLSQRIDTINSTTGYRTPLNYFEKIENQVIHRIGYQKPRLKPNWGHSLKAMAVAFVVIVFFLNKKNTVDQDDLAEFYIENYLTTNNTFEIADHSDYYFEVGNFIENYESIGIDDALEIRLYGETPTNLNLFDDE